MIQRIYIDNYRCFSNFDLVPSDTTLLVGRNGTGKSSLFDVVEGLTQIVVKGDTVRDVFGPESLTRWDERRLQRFELDLSDGEGDPFTYELVLRHDPERDRVLIDTEQVRRGQTVLFRNEDGHIHLQSSQGAEDAPFPLATVRSFLSEIAPRPETADLNRFTELFSSIQLLRLDAEGIEATSSSDHEHLTASGHNFASWYRHRQQEAPQQLASYFGRLAAVIPGFKALKLSKFSARSRELVATLEHEGRPYEIGFEELSDGQRVLIVLYALLMESSDEPRTVLLDEPGNYLALEEIQPWMMDLSDTLGDRGQLLVASHNPQVIDHLASRHSILLERPDGGPVRARTVQFERESGLTASTQLARGLIGGD